MPTPTPISIQPLGPRCLVKPIEQEQLSTVIHMPESDKTKSDQGIVMVMGTEPYGWGKVTNPNAGQLVQLKVGDKVLFQKYTGAEFNIGGEFFRVLHYDEVLVVISQIPAPVLPVASPPSLEARGTKKTGQK